LSIAAVVLEDEHDASPHLRAVGSREQTSPQQQAPPAESSRAVRKVLVTEDEPDLRATLRDIFHLEGYETVGAEDGAMAVEILTSETVDVLVLDLHMAKLDGVCLLQQIDAPPPMVIVYSAFEFYSPEAVRELVGSKVFRMLRKPVPPPELLSAVSEAIAELESLEK